MTLQSLLKQAGDAVPEGAVKQLNAALQQFMLGTVMNTEAQAADTMANMKAAGYDGIELCGFMFHPSYLMEYSCLKTLASKHKCTISKVVAMFKDRNGKWGIPYETKAGMKRCYFAKYADCKGKSDPSDVICNAAIMYGYSRNALEKRLKAKVCELCGTTESDCYEIHHINKLKNLKGKQPWEIVMFAKRRKTLVFCRKFHIVIYNQ